MLLSLRLQGYAEGMEARYIATTVLDARGRFWGCNLGAWPKESHPSCPCARQCCNGPHMLPAVIVCSFQFSFCQGPIHARTVYTILSYEAARQGTSPLCIRYSQLPPAGWHCYAEHSNALDQLWQPTPVLCKQSSPLILSTCMHSSRHIVLCTVHTLAPPVSPAVLGLWRQGLVLIVRVVLPAQVLPPVLAPAALPPAALRRGARPCAEARHALRIGGPPAVAVVVVTPVAVAVLPLPPAVVVAILLPPAAMQQHCLQ